MGVILMIMNLQGQLTILKSMNIKPNFSELAREYDLDRRTVKKYYEGYEGKSKTRNKSSRLDQYYIEIKEKLAINGVTINGVYQYFKDKYGDIGTYSNFNKYVKLKNLKPKKAIRGHARFETPPGKQAQVDWKEDIKLTSKYGEVFIFNVFSYKLGNSRFCCFTYKKNKTQQDVFESLIESFKMTGGVPKEILFDNMKTVVDITKDGRKINSKLKAFADDFGFKITLCKPRHSYTKGKVESANKFVEWILPYDGEFENESDIIELLQRINSKVNQAPNQATNIPPILLFQKEKEYLLPLPSNHIIESYMNYDRQTKVHKDSLITYKGSKYSVPPKYIGKSVTLRRIDKELQIYFNTDLISTHQLSDNKINYNECDYKEILGSVLKNKSTDDIESLAEANLKQFDAFL